MTGFAKRYGEWALVAGGSEGIGAAFARQIASRGVNVILIARNQSRLDDLAATLRSDFGIATRTAAIDLTQLDVGHLVAQVSAGCEIGLLVCNAGSRTHYGKLVDDPLDMTRAQITLNCIAPVTLCHDIGAAMARRGRGGIIVVGSLSGFAGAAGMAVYAAGKAFDQMLAESLWAELRPKGIDVLGLVAGATATPAMERAGMSLDGFSPMDPEDVAREGLERLQYGPIWVAGEANRAAADHLRSLSRAEAAEMMSAGSAASFGIKADGSSS